MKKRGFPWLRIAVHVAGWLPLAKIILDYFTDSLTVNPIQEVTQRLGRTALYFLVATLAVTPTVIVTGFRDFLPRRRALGLYTFMYASLHLLAFSGLDYGFNLPQLLALVTKKPYIIMGVLAFSMLLPQAVTSFSFFVRRMGRNWKRLHWLVYPTGIVVILHHAWAKKGNLFALNGDILKPLVWGLIVLLLLALRLPLVRRWFIRLRQQLARKAP